MNREHIALFLALTLSGCPSPAPTTPSDVAAPSPSPPSSAPTPSGEAPQSAANDASVTPATPTPATSPPEETVTGTPRERLMRSHFREVALMRKAVIDGVLADTEAPADALAKMQGLGKIEPAWQSSIDVLQYASKRIRHSSDIPAAAAAIADIGIACGACHKASGGGPDLVASAPPSTDVTLKSRMQRHVWATERLWEGIIAPSDKSWTAGAAALSGDPFPKEVLDKGGVHGRAAAARFKSLVATAGSRKRPDERGQLYASLLETCSACHLVAREKK